jgi:hypothetical protein
METITIRSDLKSFIKSEGYTEEYYGYKHPTLAFNVTNEMLKLAGKTLKVKELDGELVETENWWWRPEHFNQNMELQGEEL